MGSGYNSLMKSADSLHSAYCLGRRMNDRGILLKVLASSDSVVRIVPTKLPDRMFASERHL